MSEISLERRVNELYRLYQIQSGNIELVRTTVATNTPSTTTPTIPGQAVNQIRNGSYAHSVNSWAGNTNGTADQDYECAYWFSHSDAADTALDLSNTLSSAGRIEGLTTEQADFTKQFLLMGA